MSHGGRRLAILHRWAKESLNEMMTLGQRSVKSPLQNKEYTPCLAHTLCHTGNGFVLGTFQPSLNIVDEDPSIFSCPDPRGSVG